MKRYIKFRGKKVDTGEWVYGYLFRSTKSTVKAITLGYYIQVIGEDLSHISYEVIPETVGQFTGLKDKKGVEIYEGDVIRYETDCDLMHFEVKWNKDTLMWEAVSQVIVDEPLYYKNDFIEVIGNIHDNPESMRIENI